jgi:hypothetical protein
MKIRHRFFYNMNNKQARTLQKWLVKFNLPYEIIDYGIVGKFIDFHIHETDEHFDKIEALIHKKKLHVQTGVVFDRQDLDNAEWLYINTSEEQYPQPEGTFIEHTYDVSNYCARCGFGKNQIAPFRLKSDFEKNDLDFHGLHWVHDELFIRPNVKQIFQEESISDLSYLHPLHNKTNQEIETIYQIRMQTSSIPGLITENLMPRICQPSGHQKIRKKTGYKAFGVDKYRDDLPYCGHTNFLYPKRDMIRFKKDLFSYKPDIFQSHELFGDGVGHHLILVSQRFFQIVERHKLKGLVFTPVGLR